MFFGHTSLILVGLLFPNSIRFIKSPYAPASINTKKVRNDNARVIEENLRLRILLGLKNILMTYNNAKKYMMVREFVIKAIVVKKYKKICL
jgi:hypothetical protein